MIEILLPVYNGEKYLKEQIESFFNQTNQDWFLKIRNDGSKDGYHEIIKEYCDHYPDKIVEIDSPSENVGLVQSLNYLIEATPHGDYIMFSDQDDVWLPDKIELSLNAVQKLECQNIDKPVMVCTDVTCVDADLNVMCKSFFESQRFPNDIFSDINQMIALNVIQGCTIIINKSALSHIYPMPLIMSIHDMWIGVQCAYYGNIAYLHTPTMLYRQHSSNVAGSVNIGLRYYLYRMKKIRHTISFIQRMKRHLSFKISIFKILYYKVKYMFSRI